MESELCPHCREPHPASPYICPLETNGARSQPLPTFDTTTEKGVLDLLQEAAALYRKHAKAFLAVAAVLLIPGAVINACAEARILAPTVATATVDPVTRAPIASGPAIAGVASVLLGLLAGAMSGFLLYGLLLPLAQGATGIAAADRVAGVMGGSADWRAIWAVLSGRIGALVSALLPAALLTGVGYLFLVVPGMVLSFLFAFVPLVVLVERQSGIAALQRSYELVRTDWLRVLLLFIAYGLVFALASFVAGILFSSSLFWSELVRELLAIVLLPIPMIASFLLYCDIRQRQEGSSEQQLRAELATLRR